MKTRIVGLFLVLSSIAQAQSADAPKRYNYTVPLPQSVNCTTELPGIAQRLAHQGQVQVVDQQCDTGTPPELDPEFPTLSYAIITYMAKAPIFMNPSVVGGLQERVTLDKPTTNAPMGFYQSRSACEGDIASVQNSVEKETQKQTLASYCLVDQSLSASFILVVDSAQKSDRSLFAIKPFEGHANDNDMKAAANLLTSHGVQVFRSNERTILFFDSVNPSAAWYPEHVQWANLRLVTYDDLALCESQKAKLLARAGNPIEAIGNILACVQSTSLNYYQIEATGRPYALALSEDTATYPTLSACLKSQTAVDTQEAKADPNYIGSLCGPGMIGTDYSVTLVRKAPHSIFSR